MLFNISLHYELYPMTQQLEQ